jgi:hypothetical protein
MKWVALVAVAVMLATCGCGGGSGKVRSPLTTTAASTTSSVPTSTTQVPASASSTTPSESSSDTTCVNQDPSTAVPPIPKLTDPKTAAHATYGFTVEYPSDWYDGTDQETVTAGGVFDATTLGETTLQPTDTLMNLNVASRTNYPGLTVYRVANVDDTAEAVAGRMASQLQSSGAQTSPLESWCLDGAPARGFLARSSSGSLQESWFAFHGGALYYAFFVGKADGTQTTQDALVLGFASVLSTWKWS